MQVRSWTFFFLVLLLMTSFTPKSNNDKLVAVVNSLNFSFVKDKVVLPQ